MKTFLKWLFVLVVLAGLGGAGYWWWRNDRLTQYVQTPFGAAEPVTVSIPSGSGPRTVGRLLADGHAISDAELFYQYIRKEQAGPRLKAGEYEFKGPLTPAQVLAMLTSGQVKVYQFTVPEGLRAEEILPILARSELKLDLAKLKALSEDPAFLKKAGVPARSIEGFLYPDTYTFTREANESSVLTKMISRSLEEYAKADKKRLPGIKFDLLQTFVLASIIEKETGVVEERPRISCVFHNRMRQGIMLQTDPTVLYAMAMLRGSFVKNITLTDLKTDHPYNTYTRKGLPPGPIANPGAAALEAALHPLSCDDLFFVSRNDGTHIFCPNLKCHEAAVETWQKQFFSKKRAESKARKTR
jgi:UPF0755 protein